MPTRQDGVENRDKVCFVVSVGKETCDLKRLYFGSGNIKQGEHIHQPPGGALGYFLGGYVPPGTPNWHPVLKKISLKIDTRSRNGPIFYTPF